MKRYIPVLLFAFIVMFAGSILLSAEDKQVAEPVSFDRGYVLQIDEQQHELAMDKPQDVVIAGKTHRVVLKENPTAALNYKGISFKFPSQMLDSVDQADPEYTQWSVEGPNAVMLLFCFHENAEHELMGATMLQGLKAQYAGLALEESNVEFKSRPGVELRGTRLNVSLAEIKLVQDIYAFKYQDESYVLVLQDTLADDGGNSDDYKAFLKLFTETLEIAQ